MFQNGLLNLAQAVEAGANLNTSKSPNTSTSSEGDSFLASLVQAIDETNAVLPENLQISTSEITQEILYNAEKSTLFGDLSEEIKGSIFENLSFMQMLSVLESLQISSSEVKLTNLSTQMQQLLQSEVNFNELKNAKNLDELIDLANNKFQLNVKSVSLEMLTELKTTFPKLNEANFFSTKLEGVFKEFLNTKISNILKETQSHINAANSHTKANFKSQKDGENLLLKALQSIDENEILKNAKIESTAKVENIADGDELVLQNKSVNLNEKANLNAPNLANLSSNLKEKHNESVKNEPNLQKIAKENLNENALKTTLKSENLSKNSEFQKELLKNENLAKNEILKQTQEAVKSQFSENLKSSENQIKTPNLNEPKLSENLNKNAQIQTLNLKENLKEVKSPKSTEFKISESAAKSINLTQNQAKNFSENLNENLSENLNKNLNKNENLAKSQNAINSSKNAQSQSQSQNLTQNLTQNLPKNTQTQINLNSEKFTPKGEFSTNKEILSANLNAANLVNQTNTQENLDLNLMRFQSKINAQNLQNLSTNLQTNLSQNETKFEANLNEIDFADLAQSVENKGFESEKSELNSLFRDLSQVSRNEIKQQINFKETMNHFANDFKEQLSQFKSPITRFNITLHPSNLGEVEVTLFQRGQNLHVNFNTNTSTMNLFIQNQAEFKNSLVNMGFTGLEMNFSDQGKKDRNQKQNQRQNFSDEFELGSGLNSSNALEIILAKYF